MYHLIWWYDTYIESEVIAMFFLQSSGVYINLQYILSINSILREVQMINEDKNNLTKEEIDRLVKLLGVK